MPQQHNIELPDDLYNEIRRLAELHHKSIVELIYQLIKEQKVETITLDELAAEILSKEVIAAIEQISFVEEAPEEEKEEVSKNAVDIIKNTRDHLNMQRRERLNQAHVAFLVALLALIFGILLVFAGVICIFAVNLAVGSVTAISSIVADIVSALAFRFNKEVNDRLDKITKQLYILDKASIAMHYIRYISDVKERDQAIKDLVAYFRARETE